MLTSSTIYSRTLKYSIELIPVKHHAQKPLHIKQPNKKKSEITVIWNLREKQNRDLAMDFALLWTETEILQLTLEGWNKGLAGDLL